MMRSRFSKLLAILGVGGVAMACNSGGQETIGNPYPDTEVEPNGTVAEASDIAQYAGKVKGICESAGALDHYKLAAGTSGTASASVQSDLSLQLALLSSNGALLAQSTSTTAPFLVTSLVDSAGGVVILRVTCPESGVYE